MLLEHLYRLSLERPPHWAMWFGLPVDTSRMLDARIDMFNAYVHGLRFAVGLFEATESDWDEFSRWLMDRGEFPTEGWARKLLRNADGDHIRAIGRFWELLHEYVLSAPPAWFVRLNAEPLPSQVCNAYGPHSPDIRLPEHVRAAELAGSVSDAESGAAPDPARIRASEES